MGSLAARTETLAQSFEKFTAFCNSISSTITVAETLAHQVRLKRAFRVYTGAVDIELTFVATLGIFVKTIELSLAVFVGVITGIAAMDRSS